MNAHHPSRFTDVMTITASRRRVLSVAILGGVSIATRSFVPSIGAESSSSVALSIPLISALPDLTPRPVWQHFFEITQIPRPSHHEEEISEFLAEFGRSRGFETAVDEVGNVLIRKPATAGMADRQGVVLQAHMDMVPVKTAESDHDFENDPIDAYVEDGWVRANGTTLGADNGIGVAIILAILEAGDVPHGPIEALFTVNEEDGFTGAGAVQPGVLRGTTLINVDSEEAGVFTIGCSGGVNIDATMTYREEPAPDGMGGARIAVSGSQGGHSGIDIDKGRGNAIKLLARLLNEHEVEFDLRLATMAGGDRYNAIPRDASAVVAVPAIVLANLQERVDVFASVVRNELAGTEPELRVDIVPVDAPSSVMERGSQRRVIDALNACPDGVIRMSDSVPGLVETSTNLGTLKLADGQMDAGFLVRSSIDSARDATRDSIASVFELAGAETGFHDDYSGWAPNPDSPLLALLKDVHLNLFGTEAGVMAVHAGLETSMFAETYPGMDMISVGPTMENVHSPDERLDIASVGRTWELLVASLGRIPA
jgi:dipeptidase D